MKAYLVFTADNKTVDGANGTIVWADTPGQARHHYSLESGTKFMDLRIRRLPLFDDRLDITEREVLASGIEIGCTQCGRWFTKDDVNTFDKDGNIVCPCGVVPDKETPVKTENSSVTR